MNNFFSGRLNNKPSYRGAGAWEPDDIHESYIIYEFPRVLSLKQVKIQGSADHNKYVTRYVLFYTVDGKIWKPAYTVRISCYIVDCAQRPLSRSIFGENHCYMARSVKNHRFCFCASKKQKHENKMATLYNNGSPQI